MNYPKVYIIILNYNGWSDTIECLESVLRNKYPKYQVIVVDNNSPNNSMEYLKAWADGKLDVWVNPKNLLKDLSIPSVSKPIPYVYYTREEAEKGGNLQEEDLKTKKSSDITSKYPLIFIQSGDNLGFAGGNNIGIRYALAKGDFEYIWLLNNDTVIKKDALSKMVEIYNTHKSEKIGIVGSMLIRYDKPDTLQVLSGSKPLSCKTGNYGEYLYPNSKIHETPKTAFEIKGYIVGASMLIKKDLIKEIGLIDENYFMWAEESDFCMRALRSRWKLYCAPESMVYHKEGSSTGNGIPKQFLWKKTVRPTKQRFVITGYLNNRNGLYFVKKFFGYSGLICFFWGKFIKVQVRYVIGILMFDDDKLYRISLLVKGIKDGLKNNMGIPKEFKK